MRQGFDNGRYIELQAEHIRQRIGQFGGKLYLEFGGKLFDDNHASRVLPGFEPDSKFRMLKSIADEVEVIIAINANHIEKNKARGDLGITYDEDVLRLVDLFSSNGFAVAAVVITQYAGQPAADVFRHRLEELGITAKLHYPIEGYPHDVDLIVSPEGYGKNEFVETTRPLVVVTAPGPGSCKLATCLSQPYHEHLRGVEGGYAKFETFPVWNLPLSHPVNIAYEAATADLNDVNMIDPWHMQAYGKSAVNYNRDVEVFPVLNAIFTKVLGASPYKSPTDMGVNMAGYCICDDAVCCEASKQEVICRFLKAKTQARKGKCDSSVVDKLDLIMSKLNLKEEDRLVVGYARQYAKENGCVASSLILPDGSVIVGKSSSLLSSTAALVLNSLKKLAKLPDVNLIAPQALEPIQKLKKNCLGEKNLQLHADEALIALSVSASVNPMAELALEQLGKLRDCQGHITAIASHADEKTMRKLGVQYTCDAVYPTKRVYFD